MNQRGQAFSVFELMIAGVVAFAILIILLMVIGGVGTSAYSDAKTVMSNALKTASPSGEATVQDFVLNKGDSVDTADLSTKTDLDAKSIYFTMGQFVDTDSISVTDSQPDGSSVHYTGLTQKKMSAKVVCKQTTDALDAALERLNTGGITYDVGNGASSYCDTVQPCCAIVLMRSSK